MTNYEKNIYNTHLRVSRSQQDLPYKLRKNFTNFEDTENYVYVKRLSSFFKSYKHVDLDTFFSAPYEIYPDTDKFTLRFYTTPKAVKAYTLYRNNQQNADPDSEEQIKFTTESIYYIYRFCRDQNIPIEDYPAHKTGNMNSFLVHLKEHKINMYSLFGMANIENNIYKNDIDILEFMLPDMLQKMDTFRSKYYNSTRLKSVVKDAYSLVNSTLSS
jgi:hypothetical protein